MSNNINSNDNSVRNRSNVSQDRNLQLERGKIRLQEAFQKIKRARCKKLSKSTNAKANFKRIFLMNHMHKEFDFVC